MRLPPLRSDYITWLARVWNRPAGIPSVPVSGHAVLGYATGYGAAEIGLFVRSLRSVFDGVVALVVDDRPDVRQLLADHDVFAVAPPRNEGWNPHPVMQRFVAFDRLLRGWSDVDHVLLTDVRDVVFQANPFSDVHDRLSLFREMEVGVLGDHDFNMRYIRALAGDELAQSVSDRPCVCVGTVMGPRAEILRLCRIILMLAAMPRSAIGGAFGTDQAACNLAVHLGLIEADIFPNYGRVATLGLTPGDSLRFEAGKIINPDGSVSAIVHQHDRHPELAAAMHRLWGRGLEQCHRVQPKTVGERWAKLKQSISRRLPEPR